MRQRRLIEVLGPVVAEIFLPIEVAQGNKADLDQDAQVASA